jgi:hypothetical protein
MSNRDRLKMAIDALFPPEDEPNLGEGVSRPKPSARTREYRLLIYFQKAKPMKVSLFAETPKHALKYAGNRWPGATVELLK